MRNTFLPILWLALIFCVGCSNVQKTSPGIDPVMQRYEELAVDFARTVEQKDPDAAFTMFEAVLEKEVEMTSVCHGLSHEIGHAAFKKYGFNDALLFESDICGSGYIHGVVEVYLDKVRDIEKVLPIVCAPNAAKCFHGIGHGLMYKLNNDLPRSIELCGTFAQAFQRVQCAEGVFMEIFDSETRFHASEYLHPEDPFFACRGQSTENEGVCAFYMTRYYVKLHPRAYKQALEWCISAIPEGPRDACIKGVADSAMKQNISDPLLVEELCGDVPDSMRAYCIDGLTSYYIVHHASSAKGAQLCSRLQASNQPACEKAVRSSRKFYVD